MSFFSLPPAGGRAPFIYIRRDRLRVRQWECRQEMPRGKEPFPKGHERGKSDSPYRIEWISSKMLMSGFAARSPPIFLKKVLKCGVFE